MKFALVVTDQLASEVLKPRCGKKFVLPNGIKLGLSNRSCSRLANKRS